MEENPEAFVHHLTGLNWSFDAATGELVCEDHRVLTLTTVRKQARSAATTGIIFRRPSGGCEECPTRDECLHSEREGASKHVEISIPSEQAGRIRERLARARRKGPAQPDRFEDVQRSAGPQAVHDSLFLPARARQAFIATFRAATLHVEVQLPPEQRGPRLLALDIGDRQRRRKTWEQNLARHALPAGARVSIDVAGGPALRRMLGEPGRREAAVGGSC